jgi:hypothetical protein
MPQRARSVFNSVVAARSSTSKTSYTKSTEHGLAALEHRIFRITDSPPMVVPSCPHCRYEFCTQL